MLLATGIAGIVAGAIAAVSGFGIGSVLTPVLALHVEAKVAVAAVSIPHLIGTGLRLWLLRRHIDRRVLWSFGLTSAAGGLLGAWLHTRTNNSLLTVVFAALLIFSGVMGLSGLAQRLRFTGASAWIAGALSGLFGGLVGNQGGIRSAAMLGLDVPKHAFIATGTAVALMVDVVRMPVYVLTRVQPLLQIQPLIAAATIGVIVGTMGGERILRQVPEAQFQRVVAGMLLLLGIWMAFRIDG